MTQARHTKISRRAFASGAAAAGIAPKAAALQLRSDAGLSARHLASAGVTDVFMCDAAKYSAVCAPLTAMRAFNLRHIRDPEACAAAASAHSLASGAPAMLILSHAEIDAASAQLAQSFEAQAPLLILSLGAHRSAVKHGDAAAQESLERFGQRIVKWQGSANNAESLPEALGLALHFANAAPRAPVCISLARDAFDKPRCGSCSV